MRLKKLSWSRAVAGLRVETEVAAGVNAGAGQAISGFQRGANQDCAALRVNLQHGVGH